MTGPTTDHRMAIIDVWAEAARRELAEREFPVGSLTELEDIISNVKFSVWTEDVEVTEPGVDEAIRRIAGQRLIVMGEHKAIPIQRAAQAAYRAARVLA